MKRWSVPFIVLAVLLFLPLLGCGEGDAAPPPQEEGGAVEPGSPAAEGEVKGVQEDTTEPETTTTTMASATSSEDQTTTTAEASGTEIPEGRRLWLPDLVPRAIEEMYIRSNAQTGERELRFSTSTANRGDGPLEMRGEYDPAEDKTRAIQRIATPDGPIERFIGHFVHHEGHDHWHFEDFSRLDIYSVDEDGQPLEMVATSGKITVCIRDIVRIWPPLEGSPDQRYYRDCGVEIQGLSVGWADLYGPEVRGQQVNIEHLPDGQYILQQIADPDGLILEKNEDNNVASLLVEITGRQIRVVE